MSNPISKLFACVPSCPPSSTKPRSNDNNASGRMEAPLATPNRDARELLHGANRTRKSWFARAASSPGNAGIASSLGARGFDRARALDRERDAREFLELDLDQGRNAPNWREDRAKARMQRIKGDPFLDAATMGSLHEPLTHLCTALLRVLKSNEIEQVQADVAAMAREPALLPGAQEARDHDSLQPTPSSLLCRIVQTAPLEHFPLLSLQNSRHPMYDSPAEPVPHYLREALSEVLGVARSHVFRIQPEAEAEARLQGKPASTRHPHRMPINAMFAAFSTRTSSSTASSNQTAIVNSSPMEEAAAALRGIQGDPFAAGGTIRELREPMMLLSIAIRHLKTAAEAKGRSYLHTAVDAHDTADAASLEKRTLRFGSGPQDLMQIGMLSDAKCAIYKKTRKEIPADVAQALSEALRDARVVLDAAVQRDTNSSSAASRSDESDSTPSEGSASSSATGSSASARSSMSGSSRVSMNSAATHSSTHTSEADARSSEPEQTAAAQPEARNDERPSDFRAHRSALDEKLVKARELYWKLPEIDYHLTNSPALKRFVDHAMQGQHPKFVDWMLMHHDPVAAFERLSGDWKRADSFMKQMTGRSDHHDVLTPKPVDNYVPSNFEKLRTDWALASAFLDQAKQDADERVSLHGKSE